MSIHDLHKRAPTLAVAGLGGLLVLVACAAPKHDAAEDSAAAVTSESARATPAEPPAAVAAGDSMPNAKPTTTSAMPNRQPSGQHPEKMPNAAKESVPPQPAAPAPNKVPPKRVILDPVHAPDSAAAMRDSLHDLPSDYKAKKPERRRPLPPIKP